MADTEHSELSQYSECSKPSQYSESSDKMLTWTIDVHIDGWKTIADALAATRHSSGSSTSTIKPSIVAIDAPTDQLRPMPAHIKQEVSSAPLPSPVGATNRLS
jgi:hypothetical protein